MPNTKNILTDFHHEGLLYSLVLLFEKRLGYNLYRPIGLEWYDQDFWAIHPSRDTANQYLSLETGYMPKDGTHPLNEIEKVQDDVYFVWDKYNHFHYKAVTLEKFKKMPIDFIICSIPQHLPRFKRLIAMYKPEAKLIYQIGNQWNVEGDVKNVMASARIQAFPGINFVSYHQEFDLNIFSPYNWVQFNAIENPLVTPGRFISSFMNVPQNMPDWDLFLRMEKIMFDWKWQAFGGQGRDGNMEGHKTLAQKMRETRFIWHVKAGGDGYGHIIHNAAAVGIPAIVKKQYYQGKLAEDLMIDGETCVTIDGLNETEIVNKINHYNDERRWRQMCVKTYENFKAKVNFEKDAEAIVTFLSHLQ